MLIKDVISQALEDIGVSSDDSTIRPRYVFAVAKNIVSELLRQEVEKKGIWSNMPMQTLRMFPLERTDFAEVQAFNSGIVVYKSQCKFPTLLDTKVGKILGGVYLPTGRRVDVSDFNYILNSLRRRYSSNEPLATFRDDRLYLFRFQSETDILYTMIDGVFEDPEDIEACNCKCDEGDCIYMPDLPFFVPGYLKSRMFRMIRQELAIKLGIPLDDTNNGKSDVAGSQVSQPQTQ